MKILITGASGYVAGSFLDRFEDRSDIEILGVARRRLHRKNYASIDLSSPFQLDFAPDVVIHAAARTSPWGSKAAFRKQNVDATRNVISFCKQHGHPKLIYLSSSSVFYKNSHQFGLTEDSPIGPDFVNEYAATKYAGEELVRSYRGKFAILRPRAVFGPGDTVLLPRILRAAAKGRLPIFKSDGPVAQGDLIYIDVLCDCILRAALRDDIEGEYNLTNNEPVPIQDFLFSFLEQLGIPKPRKTISVATAMRAAWITENLYRLFLLQREPPITRFGVSVFAYSKTFDVSKMLRDFGPPSVSVEEGVAAFIEWQKKHG